MNSYLYSMVTTPTQVQTLRCEVVGVKYRLCVLTHGFENPCATYNWCDKKDLSFDDMADSDFIDDDYCHACTRKSEPYVTCDSLSAGELSRLPTSLSDIQSLVCLEGVSYERERKSTLYTQTWSVNKPENFDLYFSDASLG